MQQAEQIGCVKEATRILGDKWTPLLLRFFINNESLRFCQVQDMVEGINPRTLSARLDNLEKEGIILKVTSPEKARCEYRLTNKGRELLPVLRDMEAWSHRFAAA